MSELRPELGCFYFSVGVTVMAKNSRWFRFRHRHHLTLPLPFRFFGFFMRKFDAYVVQNFSSFTSLSLSSGLEKLLGFSDKAWFIIKCEHTGDPCLLCCLIQSRGTALVCRKSLKTSRLADLKMMTAELSLAKVFFLRFLRLSQYYQQCYFCVTSASQRSTSAPFGPTYYFGWFQHPRGFLISWTKDSASLYRGQVLPDTCKEFEFKQAVRVSYKEI